MDKRFQNITVLGSGTMGNGIAQIAATHGHNVVLYDVNGAALSKAKEGLQRILARLEEKGRIQTGEAEQVLGRITFTEDLQLSRDSGFIIEAIIEDLEIKKKVFRDLEGLVAADTVLASNTSSLSIAAIASACERSERVLGVHFFNPAPLMPLVEIVAGISTDQEIVKQVRSLVDGWGKVTVLAKDTPGFIVNRVARPFYGEALRMVEEGITDYATIDWAMKEFGGFRMGPFELMDLIGNDINFAATEGVFRETYYDPRFRPSIIQKRMVEAGCLGKKSGRGYYNYQDGATKQEPSTDQELGKEISNRIIVMLINQAVDALHVGVASAQDIDLAMTKGVNYPKGLLAWCDELGADTVLQHLSDLFEEYGEDRYRPSPLLKRVVREGRKFLQ